MSHRRVTSHESSTSHVTEHLPKIKRWHVTLLKGSWHNTVLWRITQHNTLTYLLQKSPIKETIFCKRDHRYMCLTLWRVTHMNESCHSTTVELVRDTTQYFDVWHTWMSHVTAQESATWAVTWHLWVRMTARHELHWVYWLESWQRLITLCRDVTLMSQYDNLSRTALSILTWEGPLKSVYSVQFVTSCHTDFSKFSSGLALFSRID